MSGARRPDFAAPTSAREQRGRATAAAVEALSHREDITGIVVVTRWIDGSFLVSSRARGDVDDDQADGLLRQMAIEAIGETSS